MGFDPIIGGLSAIVGFGEKKATALKYEQQRREYRAIEEDIAKAKHNASTRSMMKAANENPGEPLGWIQWGGLPYSSGVRQYVTKEQYLYMIGNGKFVPSYDADLNGWNKAWGDCKLECARARREAKARLYPTLADGIRQEPLENYYFNLPHWETPSEMWEKKKKEEELRREQEKKSMRDGAMYLLMGLVFFFFFILIRYHTN